MKKLMGTHQYFNFEMGLPCQHRPVRKDRGEQYVICVLSYVMTDLCAVVVEGSGCMTDLCAAVVTVCMHDRPVRGGRGSNMTDLCAAVAACRCGCAQREGR